VQATVWQQPANGARINIAMRVECGMTHLRDVFAAFWFHTVEALEHSLSLSVVTPSEEELAWAQVE